MLVGSFSSFREEFTGMGSANRWTTEESMVKCNFMIYIASTTNLLTRDVLASLFEAVYFEVYAIHIAKLLFPFPAHNR